MAFLELKEYTTYVETEIIHLYQAVGWGYDYLYPRLTDSSRFSTARNWEK